MARAELAATARDMSKDDDDDFYRPPEPTTAGLMFPARSKFTVRGFTLAMTPAEMYWRQIISASQHERATCLLALANPNLWNLHDQPRPVSYIDAVGRQRSHRFDYLAEYRDGSKVAMAVKPAERVEKLNFRSALTAIRRDLPKGFADKVCLITERNHHPKEVQNAELLNFFRRCPDQEADELVADCTIGLTDQLSIGELLDPLDLGARGFRAAFRAIYAGLLQANTRELISINTIVAPGKDQP
ncbi:hypothetical protein [Ruegeria sp. HKCCD7559]|uniref:hypothetical protein n=1 Tax=Ruegeria sp. HKCCD7559 TaxID=2683005 RepID=UPI0014909CAF|nr:hypothetical protein [Ruegeria sp. HKCCD7559]NOC46109.1 hypothetical protein [Ruegeria sp. HKCCD7559]